MSDPQGTAGLLTPAQMAQAAEDAAYAKATGRPLKSFLLGLTAGGYIALGFVFFITSQVEAEALPWGVAKVLGGVVFSTGLALVVLTGAELFTSSTLTLTAGPAVGSPGDNCCATGWSSSSPTSSGL
jgi:formate transporter